jgi:hypothetical protein
MDNIVIVQSNLKRLLKIQLSRLTAHEKMLKQARYEYKEAYETLKERKENINLIKQKIDNVYDYSTLKSGHTTPEMFNSCNSYLFWLNYDLEMHEYYHNQEEDRVKQTNTQYLIAKHNWYKQKRKSEKLNELYVNNKNIQQIKKEEQEDESFTEIKLTINGTHYE